jgi:UDP-N-acetylglucosamine--N-acetylmuramyl-(pentapeptide) pyrophosphoryl-undecaprenol N-acetylglucosamine transferase
VRAFLDDVAERMAAASLVLCRSGASTVAELCAAGRPSILVPFPFSAGDHQTANARALCAAGAAEMTADAELTAATLAAAIEDAMQAPHVLAQRARAARRLANPEAAALIVQLAQESVASRRDGAQDERRSA